MTGEKSPQFESWRWRQRTPHTLMGMCPTMEFPLFYCIRLASTDADKKLSMRQLSTSYRFCTIHCWSFDTSVNERRRWRVKEIPHFSTGVRSFVCPRGIQENARKAYISDSAHLFARSSKSGFLFSPSLRTPLSPAEVFLAFIQNVLEFWKREGPLLTLQLHCVLWWRPS